MPIDKPKSQFTMGDTSPDKPKSQFTMGDTSPDKPKSQFTMGAVVPRRMASTTAAQEPPRSAKALPQMSPKQPPESPEPPGAGEPRYVLSPWREAGRGKLLAAILFMTSLPGSNSNYKL